MAAYAREPLTLGSLLDGIADPGDSGARKIHGLSLDSRQVAPGDCFVALKGENASGVQFVSAAIAAGASAALVEDSEAVLAATIPVVCIAELRHKLGLIASRFFQEPSSSLDIIAVTGTNGKTTITNLCAQALKEIRGVAGYVGTLGYGLVDNLISSVNTTPDPITLQRLFAELLAQQCDSVAVEVSSHAIVQSRVVGTAIDVAVFTNVGHDHLDYHKNLADYAEVKKSFFRTDGISHAIINIDDEVGRDLLRENRSGLNYWSYSVDPSRVSVAPQHLCLARTRSVAGGVTMTIKTPEGEVDITTSLIGEFNSQNVIAALAALMALGVCAASAATALTRCSGVAGRMQRVDSNDDHGVAVFVDFAHTPDSLARVLSTLREITPRRLICVFGCGGDRDRTKRGPMGRAAENGADWVIITSDNPRDENNADIAAEILCGVGEKDSIEVIHDRNEAIKAALEGAERGDTVLIAGKGHELSQEINGVSYPFSDTAVASCLLREWGR